LKKFRILEVFFKAVRRRETFGAIFMALWLREGYPLDPNVCGADYPADSWFSPNIRGRALKNTVRGTDVS